MYCICVAVTKKLHRGIREKSSSDRRGKRAERKESRFQTEQHSVASHWRRHFLKLSRRMQR